MASILNPKFKYVPSYATDIRETFKKHKVKPVNKKRQQKLRLVLNGAQPVSRAA